MSLTRCSSCEQRNSPKYAQVTWAWNVADGTRVAFRQRLCPGCFAQLVLALDMPREPGDRLSCPSCGIDTEDDYDAVYATCFVPGFGKETYEWPLCAVHAVDVRVSAQRNSLALENKVLGAEASAPSNTSLADVWSAIGLHRGIPE